MTSPTPPKPPPKVPDDLFLCTHCGERVTLDVMREHEDSGKSTSFLDDMVVYHQAMSEEVHDERDV